jgi:hypothetical protein
MVAMLGRGLYTFPEAAKLTGLRLGRVREWFRGRLKSAEVRRPVFQGDYAPVDTDYAISFFDLIDLYVAGQLREHGVSLQMVRKVYSKLEDELQSAHPFCRKELLTDGKKVFTRGLDRHGQEELTEVLTRQGVFPQVLLPFLRRIDYDRVKLLALRWRIADKVLVDPTVCFGKPVVEGTGVATAILNSSTR